VTVLIAGAGIGGLALGLSLDQLGVRFRIFESVQNLRPLGVGINLQPHAVRELYDLGLADDLDRIGLRTQEVGYYSAQGGHIWSEPRGKFAGYNWPQISVHRGDLQMLLHDRLMERAGAGCLQTGAMLNGWRDQADGIEVSLKTGGGNIMQSGDVLVAADGINSAARAQMFPQEGRAHWAGIMMWRGVTVGPRFLDGRTMAMAGRKDTKFVCYPIRDIGDDQCLINWICDRAYPGDHDWAGQDWTRQGRLDDFLPAFANWDFDWLGIPAVIRGAETIWEYPMVDRNPLPRWTFGRATLLGDAAHAMYPIGSNGASQAILDARVLARSFRDHGVGAAALQNYEDQRRDKVNALLLANRGDGPDKVLDIVAGRAPDGFADVHDVISATELGEHAEKYKTIAGMSVAALNASPSILPP